MSNESSTPSASPSESTTTNQAPTSSEPSKAGKGSTVDAAKAASTSPKEKVEAAVEKRRYKVKIDKEEKEVDEDELVRGYQLRQASDKRFKEAHERQQQIEEVLRILKENPRKALEHPEIGVNVRKFAEDILARELEEELLDPKEKELRSLKAKMAEIEKEKETREAEVRKTEEEKQIQGFTQAYAKEIEEAVKPSGLPYNNHVVNRIKDYMLTALNHGYEVSAKDVLPYVKEDFMNDLKSLFASSDDAIIADLIGEDGMKRVRNFDLKRLKDPSKDAKKTEKEQAPLNTEKREPEIITVNDYFEKLRERFKD